MKTENGRVYYGTGNTSIESVVFRAMKDYDPKHEHRTAFLFYGKGVYLNDAIEEIFRLSGADHVFVLYNTTPYCCCFEFYKDDASCNACFFRASQWSRRGHIDDGQSYQDTLEMAKQTLFHAYMIRPGGTVSDMESFMFNFGKFVENLQKIKETYVK